MLSSAELFFIIFYWLLFSALILKVTWFKKLGISVPWIAGIFLLKVMLGVAYGVIHFHYYGGGDSFAYFKDSLLVMPLLTENTIKFFRLVIDFISIPPDTRAVDYDYNHDLSSFFLVRLHSLLNLFTFCHYYGNVVLYNFFTLIGQLYLFRFFASHNPDKKILLLLLLFVFPSVSFWSSGFHKDGVALSAIGVILFQVAYLFDGLTETKETIAPALKNNLNALDKLRPPQSFFLSEKLPAILILLAGICVLAVVRNYLLLLLMPCIMAYYFINYSSGKGVLKYLTVIILFYFVIFQLKILNPHWDILNEMAWKQQEFLAGGEGKTNIDLPALQPNIISLIQLIPTALFHCLFLPSAFNLSSPIQLSSAVDNLLIILLFMAALMTAKRDLKNVMPLLLLCSFFAVSVFIFTGALVPNIGALVRYKMPGTLFLVVGILSLMDVAKIKRLLHLK